MARSLGAVRLESADGLLTITLERPEAGNALNADMSVELAAALRHGQRDESTRCIILTGSGEVFCAGYDLNELRAGAHDALDLGALLKEKVNPLILRLRTMAKPIVAAVNGRAAGVGVSLALAADLRICATRASFQLDYVKTGLVPDAAATLTLIQHVGYARAAELCLLGAPLPAERAHQLGLVSRVVADAALADEARALARELARLPAQTIALTKRALGHAWTATLDEQMEYEAFLQTTAGRTAQPST